MQELESFRTHAQAGHDPHRATLPGRAALLRTCLAVPLVCRLPTTSLLSRPPPHPLPLARPSCLFVLAWPGLPACRSRCSVGVPADVPAAQAHAALPGSGLPVPHLQQPAGDPGAGVGGHAPGALPSPRRLAATLPPGACSGCSGLSLIWCVASCCARLHGTSASSRRALVGRLDPFSCRGVGRQARQHGALQEPAEQLATGSLPASLRPALPSCNARPQVREQIGCVALVRAVQAGGPHCVEVLELLLKHGAVLDGQVRRRSGGVRCSAQRPGRATRMRLFPFLGR